MTKWIDPNSPTLEVVRVKAAVPKNWRQKKTLTRRLEFRPIEAEDVKYAYAAYKMGALKDMAAPFDELGMSADEFNIAFQTIVLIPITAPGPCSRRPKRGFCRSAWCWRSIRTATRRYRRS